MADRGSTTESDPTEKVRARRARSDEATAVLELLDGRARWLHDHGIVDQWPSPFPPTTITPALDAGHTWVVEDDGHTIVATFTIEDADSLWPDDDPLAVPAYLHRLAVALGRPGLGRRLIGQLRTELAVSGRSVMRLDCLTSNVSLCAYYEQAGFLPRAYRTVPCCSR